MSSLASPAPPVSVDQFAQIQSYLKLILSVGGGAITLGLAFGAYVVTQFQSVSGQIHAVDIRVTGLEAKFDRHIEWHNGRQGAAVVVAPEPAFSALVEGPAKSAEPLVPHITQPKDWSGDRVRVAPPVCADPKTHKRLSCDQVASCYDRTAWKPSVAQEIAKELGVDVDKLTLCAPTGK